jgi:hypothetical protein
MIKLDTDVEDFQPHRQLKLDQSQACSLNRGRRGSGSSRSNGRTDVTWYSDRDRLLLRPRLGGPDGEILCDRGHNAVCETCRVLMSRGIVGAFETWKLAWAIRA